jgi:hypothetical protein
LNSLDLNLGNLRSGFVGRVVNLSPLDESDSSFTAKEGSSLNGAGDGEGGDEDRGEHVALSRDDGGRVVERKMSSRCGSDF